MGAAVSLNPNINTKKSPSIPNFANYFHNKSSFIYSHSRQQLRITILSSASRTRPGATPSIHLPGAPAAAAVHALDHAALLQLGLRHAADAVRAEIRVARLNAAQTAQILVAGLLPLGNQIGVGDLFAHTVLVQLAADRLAPVEQVVDVARLLVVDLEDGPQRLADAFALVRIGFGWNEQTHRG